MRVEYFLLQIVFSLAYTYIIKTIQFLIESEGSMEEIRELYLAAKYEVEHFKCDHGMNLADMWAEIKSGEHKDFWRAECLEDYRLQRVW